MNKKNAVVITIVGIAAIVIAVIGATYAFFRAGIDNVRQAGENVIVATQRLGTITFFNDFTFNEEMYPGKVVNRSFQIQSSPDTATATYNVILVVRENDFASPFNLALTVTPPSGGSAAFTPNTRLNPTIFTPTPTGTDVVIGTATINQGQSHTWNVAITLLDTGENHITDVNRAFAGHLKIETQG